MAVYTCCQAKDKILKQLSNSKVKYIYGQREKTSKRKFNSGNKRKKFILLQ